MVFCLATPHKSFAAVPNSFVNGVVADATEVNANFNYFENKFSTTSGHDHDGTNSNTTLKGLWNGTAIGATYGGTGLTVYASGDMVVANTTTTLSRLAVGTLGDRLMVTGTSTTGWVSTLFKIGTLTRDTTVATGNVAYTGVGFQPKAVIFLMTENNTAGEMSIGIDTQTTRAALYDYGNTTAGAYQVDNTGSIFDNQTSANQCWGSVSSFDSDGFTISWTKSNSPTGTITIFYLAFR